MKIIYASRSKVTGLEVSVNAYYSDDSSSNQ